MISKDKEKYYILQFQKIYNEVTKTEKTKSDIESKFREIVHILILENINIEFSRLNVGNKKELDYIRNGVFYLEKQNLEKTINEFLKGV